MMLNEKKCDCCGEIFFPTQYHVYKQIHKGRVMWFDKYTCLLKFRAMHEIKKRRTKQ